MGKVKVFLRVANSKISDEKKGSFLNLDKKKKQVTFKDPDVRDQITATHEQECQRRVDVSATKCLPLMETSQKRMIKMI